MLIQGTPYMALYNNSDGVFYLHAMGGNAYGVPLLGGMDDWDTVTPSSAFIFPTGQQLSRTGFAAAFARWGTTYGAGNGTTTFNAPDKTGRASFMKEASATRLTSTYATGNSMGAVLGADHTSNAIAKTNLPNINLTSDAQNVTIFGNVFTLPGTAGPANAITTFGNTGGGGTTSGTYAVGGQNVPLGGSGTALAVGSVPPGIICNYIIRVL